LKSLGIRLSPGEQLQDSTGDIQAPNLRHFALAKTTMLVLGPEAQTKPLLLAPGASGSLVRGSLADANDLQAVQTHSSIETHRAGIPRIDHGGETFHGDGAFGNVGRQDHPPEHGRLPLGLVLFRPPERAVLLSRREVSVKGKHLDPSTRSRFLQQLLSAPDLSHSRQEGQDVPMLLVQHAAHSRRCLFRNGGLRAMAFVQDLHGIPSARTSQNLAALRPVSEKSSHGLRVQSGGHGDQPQIIPHLPLNGTGQGEGEVRVQAPFVELVEDQGADAFEKRVGLETAQKDAFGHHQKACAARGPVIKTDVVADLFSEAVTTLLGDAPGGGPNGEATGLDEPDRASIRASPQDCRRHTGRLAGACVRQQDEIRFCVEDFRQPWQLTIDG